VQHDLGGVEERVLGGQEPIAAAGYHPLSEPQARHDAKGVGRLGQVAIFSG